MRQIVFNMAFGILIYLFIGSWIGINRDVNSNFSLTGRQLWCITLFYPLLIAKEAANSVYDGFQDMWRKLNGN